MDYCGVVGLIPQGQAVSWPGVCRDISTTVKTDPVMAGVDWFSRETLVRRKVLNLMSCQKRFQ